MSSKTKLVVLHMKELIYTAIFILLGFILLFLLISMFTPKESTQKTSVPKTKQETQISVPLAVTLL